MSITGKHVYYYHVCWRKLWLFNSGIGFHDMNASIADGTFIHDTSYAQRAAKYKELQIDGVKIDFYDPVDKIIHEIKRSEKLIEASRAQLKYYLFTLRRHGIEGASGLLEIPTARKTEAVVLSEEEFQQTIPGWEAAILEITEQELCPPVINKPFCKQCSYYEFCYIDE